MPSDLRQCIRHVLLDEDRKGVAFPECHAQGLLPFCQENARLRIVRRVNLFKAVFAPYWSDALSAVEDYRTRKELDAGIAVDDLRHWIDEAAVLRAYGMPANSFSMVFDGSPEFQQQIWDNLKRAAAVQEAMLERSRRGIGPTTPNEHLLSRPKLCLRGISQCCS